MNFLKKLFCTPKDVEVEHLKARLDKAEKLLKQISEDPHTKISVSMSLDIWEFIHFDEFHIK